MPGKNSPNTCQGAMHGTGRYDCSCPVITNGGVQCRTMPTQRPCSTPSCTRWECAAFSGSDVDTNVGTENGFVPFSASMYKSREEEPTYTVEGLTGDDMERVRVALFYLMSDEMPGTDEYRMIDDLRDKFRS